MSKRGVKSKVLDAPSKSEEKSEWIRLAEDAEQDAAKARERSEQLIQAARIFRQNAESGEPWPTEQNVTT